MLVYSASHRGTRHENTDGDKRAWHSGGSFLRARNTPAEFHTAAAKQDKCPTRPSDGATEQPMGFHFRNDKAQEGFERKRVTQAEIRWAETSAKEAETWSKARGVVSLQTYRSLPREKQVNEIGKLTALKAEIVAPLRPQMFSVLALMIASFAFVVSVINSLSAPPPTPLPFYVPLLIGTVTVGGFFFRSKQMIQFLGRRSSRLPWIEHRLTEFQFHLEEAVGAATAPGDMNGWEASFGPWTVPIRRAKHE